VLEGLGVGVAVEADAVRVEGDSTVGGAAEVRFSWAAGVPQDLRGRLHFKHAVERIELPAPPSPPPTLDLPAPE
jgi:hypothetical protein